MKIAGVVVLYNPNSDIKDNINSYLKDIDKLYVIDNSNNDDANKLLPKSKKIEYHPNYDNLGIAVALNKGAELARKDGFKWLLTMDQDSYFEKDILKKMISFVNESKDNKVGIVSPWHNTKNGAKKPNVDVEEVMEVMTSGNLLNLDIHKKIGGFKEWLFIDSVDIEYGLHLNSLGYKVIRLNYLELEHELGNIKIKHVLGRNLVCSNHNYIRRYYIVRNIYYVNSLYKDIFPDYCNFIVHGLQGAFRNVLVFEKDKYRKIRNMYRGYRDFKKGIKGKYPYKN